jgi:hypothetical protein
LNSYSWCGDSSYTTSGYDVLVADFTSATVPVFFSEYGCNVPAPRIFTEVPVLYGPLVTPVLSGGLVYEYSQETSNYGLVTINNNGSAQLRSDYDTLQAQFNTLNGTSLQGVIAQNTTKSAPKCASSLITASGFAKNFTIPSIPTGAQALIDNGISNAPVGKIVSVTSVQVTQTVQQANGVVMTGLVITPLPDNESNNPSGASSNASSTTTAAPAATTTKKSSAVGITASLSVIFSCASIAIVFSTLI